MKQILTKSPEETFAFGKEMGKKAHPGEVIALDGDLGSGKTVFTQGFAAGLGIIDAVTSPTFTIMQIYEGGRIPLYHFDVYRIEDPDEMYEIGYEEYFFGEGAVLVEWAGQIEELMPEDTIWISFSRDADGPDDERTIRIGTKGEMGSK